MRSSCRRGLGVGIIITRLYIVHANIVDRSLERLLMLLGRSFGGIYLGGLKWMFRETGGLDSFGFVNISRVYD